MGTVTTLPRGKAFTRRDLESMPDDGRRYEVIDGALVVTPAPSLRHQWVLSSLLTLLTRAASREFKVLCAPLDVALDDVTVLQPDLVVVRTDDIRQARGQIRPLLVVEILSPSTRRIDLTLKHSRYESAGYPSYWVVDPDEPSMTAWEMVDGKYAERGHAADDDSLRVSLPFEVTITPARLLDFLPGSSY